MNFVKKDLQESKHNKPDALAWNCKRPRSVLISQSLVQSDPQRRHHEGLDYSSQFLPPPINPTLRQFTSCLQPVLRAGTWTDQVVRSGFAMVTASCRAKALRQVKVRPANNWEKYSSRVEFFCPMQTDMVLFGFHSKMLAHDSREENLTNMEYKIKSICKIFLWMSVIFRDESNDGN